MILSKNNSASAGTCCHLTVHVSARTSMMPLEEVFKELIIIIKQESGYIFHPVSNSTPVICIPLCFVYRRLLYTNIRCAV
jgi:hypothetical protein